MAAAMFALAGCFAGGVPSGPGSGEAVAAHSPIKHVVFIIQENRSFNDLFMGYPEATTQDFGNDEKGRRIPLRARSLATGWDVDHSASAFFAACDGQGKLPGTDCKMDGWGGDEERNDPPNAPYSYVERQDVQPYWSLARQYVLADRMFTSNLDGSFIAHQYAVAAYASHGVDSPRSWWGCEGGKADTLPTLTSKRAIGPDIRACFDNPTIADEADAGGVTWRFYAGGIYRDGGMWSSYQADSKIFYGPDWSANVISPSARFFDDVAKGELAAITWITPTWGTSDHPGLWDKSGPSWVASLVDAVGASRFWDSTAIFITWDDWGGWFDPVAPPYEDYDGLGFRVPLIVVSPYAKRGYVTHVQYETASVLRFMEDDFGLAPLAKADRRAADPATDVFDYNAPPRAFKKIAGDRPGRYWMKAARGSSAVRAIQEETGND